MKIKISLLVFLFFTITFVGQTNKIDSLKQSLIGVETHDTIKIITNLHIGKEFGVIDLDSCSSYVKKALKLSLLNNNYRAVKIYSNLGLLQFYNSNSDSARYYYDEALKVLDINDNTIERSTVYANYSLSYQNSSGDFEKKILYNQKAIDLVKDNDVEVCLLYFNHSVIYVNANFNEMSKKYLKLAYLSSKKARDYRVEGATIRQLAHHFIQEKKLDSARIYLERGLELCEATKSPEICFQINSKLGELYDDLELYSKADKVLLIAKDFAIKRKFKYDIMASNILLGQHELKRGNYKKSISYFQEFEDLYKENVEPHLGSLAYKSWAEVESKNGNYKKSNRYLQKHLILQDSIYSQKNREILVNADAKYETEKKDKEIVQQQLQIEKTEGELQKKKTETNYLIGIAIFLLVASILTWFLFQQRQKRKNQEIVTLKREHQIKTLETLIEGEEKERFRIAKELHDGVNGDLSAIKYKLSTLLEMNNTVIKEAITMIDNSCNQVRAISHNLVPPSLENFNLLEAVQEYCEKSDASHSEKITFQHLGDTIKISKKEEVNIFRIIQELVTNSIKHAKATKIDVQISCRKKVMQITVEDNGEGFDKNNIEERGIGLKNIQSRVDYLHGTIDLISNKKGTSTTIEIDRNDNN